MATAKPASKEKSSAPIVVRRIKKGGHGFHGGVWKIAYADFVTAMMAFFLLMWVLGSTTTGDLAGISAYFQNPLRVSIQGGQGSGDATRPLKGGGENVFRTAGQEAKADSLSNQRRVSDASQNTEESRLERRALEKAKDTIEEQIGDDPQLKPLQNQVFMVVGPDGLRIQIVDDKNRPMFAVGSAEPYPYTKRLLRTIGKVLSELTNNVRFEGHTDNRLFGNGPAGYGNWELSSERANAARRELVIGGMDEKRTTQVSGFADSINLNPDDPADPVNRRISITVMRTKPAEAPPAASTSATSGTQPTSGVQVGKTSETQIPSIVPALPGVIVAPQGPAVAPATPTLPPSVTVPPRVSGPDVPAAAAPPVPPAAPTNPQASPATALPLLPPGPSAPQPPAGSILYQLPQRPGLSLPGVRSP